MQMTMISAESMEELLVKLKTWKTEMEKKGLRVNMGKTKIMVSGMDLDLLKKSGKDPCGVCQKGVGSNANFCCCCLCWIDKKCSGIKGPLRPDPDFRCARCLGKARPIDGRTVKEVKVDDEKLEAVPEFCYLGDMLSTGGGCELAAVTHCKCAWGKFRQLLPPSHKPQCAPCYQRSGVINMCKECDTACSRDLGHDSGYT